MVGGTGTWPSHCDVCLSSVDLFCESLTGDIDTVVEYGEPLQGGWRTPGHYYTFCTDGFDTTTSGSL